MLYYLRRLKKKGAETYVRFPFGIVESFREEEQVGDCFGVINLLIKSNPGLGVFGTHFMLTPSVYLIDPTLAKDLMMNPSNYTKSQMLNIYKLILGPGLVFLDGKLWKKHRKILSEIFHFDFIASHIPTVVQTSLDIFERELESAKGGMTTVNILDLFQNITGDLVFQIFFGKDIRSATIDGLKPTQYLANLIEDIEENTYSWQNILFGEFSIRLGLFERNRLLKRKARKLREFCLGIIHDRRSNLESCSRKDLLNILLELQAQQKGGKDSYLTDEEALHEFIIMFLAGMDTTAHLLAMAAYFYTQEDADTRMLLLQEAKEIAGAGSSLNYGMLNKCEYLHAFLKETLRLTGPSPLFFERQAVKGHYLQDLWIPKGARVNICFKANNINNRYYRNPDKFNLFRWIPTHEDFDEQASKDPFIFTPFSAGPRSCLGQNIAMIEAKIILSIFIAKYIFTIPDDYKLRMCLRFVYEPFENLELLLCHRES